MSEHNLKHPKTAFRFTHVCECGIHIHPQETPVVVSSMLGSLHSPKCFSLAEKLALPIQKGKHLVFHPSLINCSRALTLVFGGELDSSGLQQLS